MSIRNQLLEEILAATATNDIETRINNTNGFAAYVGSSTPVTPQVFVDGVSQKLINDKAITVVESLPDGVLSYLDGTTSTMTPDQNGGIYGFTIGFTVDPTVKDKRVQVIIVIPDGISPGVDIRLDARTFRLAKDVGAISRLSLYFATGSMPAMITNGVQALVTMLETDADVYEPYFAVNKLNAPLLP